MYVPFSGINIDGLAPEEMEDAHVNVWEGKNPADAVDSEDIPVSGQNYQNFWSSEEDPRAVPLPAEICPVHNLACKKGICEDMSKIIRDKKKAELKEQWEKAAKKKKEKGTHDLLFFF